MFAKLFIFFEKKVTLKYVVACIFYFNYMYYKEVQVLKMRIDIFEFVLYEKLMIFKVLKVKKLLIQFLKILMFTPLLIMKIVHLSPELKALSEL